MVVKLIRFLTLAILFWSGVLHAQEFVFRNIQMLPGTINSEAEETMPLLSPDGKTLFFTRLMHPKNTGGEWSGLDIWTSKLEGNKWSVPDNTSLPFNDEGNNVVVGVGSDGNIIYLMNSSASRPLKGIYFSKLLNGKWTTPELVPIEGIDHDGFVGFYVSPDFDVIFISMKGNDSRGQEDLYVCVKSQSGQWQAPRNLGSTINTAGFEISPFLSADKKRLYFASNGHKGFGDADIFYSERLYDSWEAWSLPKNLGEGVNSSSFDAYFIEYNEGRGLFSSNRQGNLANIYSADITKIENDQLLLLTAEDLQSIFGAGLNAQLRFLDKNSELLAAHRELLWFISSKLISEKSVKLTFEISPFADPELIDDRIKAIVSQLATAGLEGSRIIREEKLRTNENLTSNTVNLLFVR